MQLGGVKILGRCLRMWGRYRTIDIAKDVADCST